MFNALPNFFVANDATQGDLGKHCAVSQGTVSKWCKNGVSPDYIEDVAEFTGLSPAKLRPDLARIFQNHK